MTGSGKSSQRNPFLREGIRQGDIPGVQLRRRRALPVAPAEGWAWLTDPRRLERWLADRVEGERGEASVLRLVSGAGQGERVEEIRGVSWQEGRSWTCAFERMEAGWASATRLVFEVDDRGDGCEVSVLQDGFQNLSLSVCMTVWEDYRRRWQAALERLAEVASVS